MKNKFFAGSSLILSVLLSMYSNASDKIEFPTEEIAQETVLPKFDKTTMVKNRLVETDGRIELAAMLGFHTSEPIYNNVKYGLNLSYHLSEQSAMTLNYNNFASGLNSTYTDALYEKDLDFSRAPKRMYSLYGLYEWKVYYGKISFTREKVTNLVIYPMAGLGVTGFEHKVYPGIVGGIGQKIYFTRNFALRTDFLLQFTQTVNPFLADTEGADNDGPSISKNNPRPQPSDFSDKYAFGTHLELGFTYLF